MRYFYLIIISAIIVAACSDTIAESTTPELSEISLSENGEIKLGAVPAWVETSELAAIPKEAAGLMFVRRNDLITHLNEAGQYSHVNQRVKIWDARALEAGNIAMTWNPASGTPAVHFLNIHRGDEIINVLENNSFEIMRREDQLEQSVLNGNLTGILRVPDLRVGDELEFSYTVPAHDPTLRENSFGFMVMAAAPLPGQHKIGINWVKGQAPDIQLTDDLSEQTTRNDRSLYVSFLNPQMLMPPKDAPARYDWQRMIEYSDFRSWSDVSKRFNALFDVASRLEEDSQIIKEAEGIASANESELEKMKAALELVQQQVRYIYVGLEGGNIDPASADDTWRRRYGDCKGKTALLAALLHELGIESEVVLANNSGLDDGFDERLPNPALFDHVLLRARIDGSLYWLDPTLPVVIEPKQKPLVSYRYVLPLTETGSMLEKLPEDLFDLPQEMGIIEYDARAGFGEPAKISNTTVKRGVDGLVEYFGYSSMTSDQIKVAYINALAGSSEWETVEDVTYEYDRNSQASIVTISGTGMIDWDKESQGRYLFTLPGGGFSPPSKRQRLNSAEADEVPYYATPGYSCYTTTVRLPEDTHLKNWGFNSVYNTKLFGRVYYRMMEKNQDGSIRMVRSSRVVNTEMSPRQALRENARIENFDNSKARIEYDPNRAMKSWGILQPVAATYETDWTDPSAPCLPILPTETD